MDKPSRIPRPDLFLDYSVQVLSFSFYFVVFLEWANANDTQPNPITYYTRNVFQVMNLLRLTNSDDTIEIASPNSLPEDLPRAKPFFNDSV